MTSKTTGPILVAGAVTWANQVVLDPPNSSSTAVNVVDVSGETIRIGTATGLLAAAMYGLERLVPELAVGLAYTMLLTSLIVRFNNRPTPLERALDVVTQRG